jgi:hypothetical protein
MQHLLKFSIVSRSAGSAKLLQLETNPQEPCNISTEKRSLSEVGPGSHAV